ncbi:putative Na+-dependent transporter [Bacteriovorax stolpii]|nr:hypothetical protein [Bacteriovorax stolpii]TDP54150.1 putative Na+-dependent transporter [Bacteriovorax stolpii]
MRQLFYPTFVLIGILLGWSFPFYALAFSKWAFVVLFILLSINMISVDLKIKSIFNYNSTDFYFIFFSYFFIPALVFTSAHFLNVAHTLKLGFFITGLAPLAIITPQFLSEQDKKQLALKHILSSTFLFPLYFSIMVYCFFNQMIKVDILSIILDSLLLTILPILLVFSFKKIFKKSSDQLIKKVGQGLPLINMLLIGILSFIFVGSSYLKNDLHHFMTQDWIAIICFAVFQDFGVFFLAKLFKFPKAYAIAVSMKNVPFVGIFALLFFPQALIAIISILVVHIFLIFFHSLNQKSQSPSTN